MDNLALVPLTLCLSKATTAAGTTTTYSTTGTTVYAIKGKAYSTAAKSNVATPTVDITDGLAFTGLTANQGSLFVFCFDTGGTLRVAQGSVEALDVSGNFINAPTVPGIPDTVCPFGYLVAKAGSTTVGTWTFGSSNLSGVTGLTYTFGDLITLPDRPFVS